jgi:hypothetical protein
MRRRHFIQAKAGSAAAWPLAAPAQQGPLPVIGILGRGTARWVIDRNDLVSAGFLVG